MTHRAGDLEHSQAGFNGFQEQLHSLLCLKTGGRLYPGDNGLYLESTKNWQEKCYCSLKTSVLKNRSKARAQ